MPRFKLTIEYDGTAFAGWQRQPGLPAVQAAFEDAVQALTGTTVEVYGAGRTDAGVHAAGQVAHVDLTRDWAPTRLADALNAHLRPAPVAVLEVSKVADDFHARFSATARHYRYQIVERRAPLALGRNRFWRLTHRLDVAAINDAALELIGHHDFSSFRSTQCQAKSPMKTLDRLAARRHGGQVLIEASARSFLHNQVRAMVGSLVQVGLGKWTRADLARARDARDRQAAGPNAPPEGLILMRVDY